MGLVYQREINSQVRFAIWRVEESADDLLSRLQLNDRERSVLAALNKGNRTLHWLSTRVLLRLMLDTPGYIDCPSDQNGKPYLTNFPQKISLTHSFDYVAVMMSDCGEVGIDLELIGPKILRIAHKFMKPEELSVTEKMPEDERIHYLYACWCAKEAVYKLQGKKGVSFREHMTIPPFNLQEQGELTLVLQTDQTDQIEHTDQTEHTENAPQNESSTITYQVHYQRFLSYMLGFVMENSSTKAPCLS